MMERMIKMYDEEKILKLTQQWANLNEANRRKKKALRQANKDLEFLRKSLDEAQETIIYLRKEINLLLHGDY